MAARAVVTAWALDNTPDYMAVDLTATGGADTQTYYPAADFVPGGVTNGIYKTTKLLMRKIMAKDVTWTMGSVAEIGRTATPALASASCALPDCGKHVRSGSRAAPEFDARNDTCYYIAHLGHSRKQMKGKQR